MNASGLTVELGSSGGELVDHPADSHLPPEQPRRVQRLDAYERDIHDPLPGATPAPARAGNWNIAVLDMIFPNVRDPFPDLNKDAGTE